MRKIILVSLLSVLILSADPFNTVSAWIIPPGHGYFGPSVPFTISEGQITSATHTLWGGAGLGKRFDFTIMAKMEYEEDVFDITYAMLEGRYGAVEKENPALTPALDLYIPLQSDLPWIISPGLMTTVIISRFSFHGNLFPSVSLQGLPVGVYLALAAELKVLDFLSVYLENNTSLSYDFYEGSAKYVHLYNNFLTGVSISPYEAISINVAMQRPFQSGQISPAFSIYVNI